MADQTKPQWKPLPGLGTGVYVLGSLYYPRFSYISSIGYVNFDRIMRGANPLAHQWVPHTVANEAQVRNPDCGRNLACTEPPGCVTPGCQCLGGICRGP
jgi:hypothetical protein